MNGLCIAESMACAMPQALNSMHIAQCIHTTEIIQRNEKNPPKELTMSNGWLQQKMLFIVITQTKNPEYTIKKVSDRTCTNREFDAVYYCTYYGYERIRTRKRKLLPSECVLVFTNVKDSRPWNRHASINLHIHAAICINKNNIGSRVTTSHSLDP